LLVQDGFGGGNAPASSRWESMGAVFLNTGDSPLPVCYYAHDYLTIGVSTVYAPGKKLDKKSISLLRRGRVQDPSQDLKGFINACVRGDATARRAFQETYGALIYTFPVRIYHLSKDEAGDFYLYVFL
jgi:hypothetical protein